jgi:hypothetical protein
MSLVVCLFASDVASYLGENKWSVIGSFERLLKKLVPEKYQDALEKMNETRNNLSLQSLQLDKDLEMNKLAPEAHTILKKQVTSDLKKTEERVVKVTKSKETYITDILGEKSKDIMSSDLSNVIKQRELNKLISISQDIPKEQHLTFKQDIRSLVNTAHGTKTEDYTLSTYETENNVILDKSQKFYKKDLFEITRDNGTGEGIKFTVGGKMDGIDHDSQCIVEIKNRTRGLFYELRDYEHTQIMIYMYLLGYKSAKLVEMYKTKRTVKKHCIDIEYNQLFVDSMVSKLRSFCERVIEYTKSTNLVEYFSKTDAEKECEIWGVIENHSETLIGGDEDVCMLSSDSDNY